MIEPKVIEFKNVFLKVPEYFLPEQEITNLEFIKKSGLTSGMETRNQLEDLLDCLWGLLLPISTCMIPIM